MAAVIALEELLHYNEVANQRVIETLIEFEEYDEFFDTSVSHIMNAHDIWNSRLLVKNAKYGVWDVHPRTGLSDINVELHTITRQALEELGAEREIHYSNIHGSPFSNTVNEIVYHIANHGTHHRAQITYKLRQQGIEPPKTDYIFHKRSGI